MKRICLFSAIVVALAVDQSVAAGLSIVEAATKGNPSGFNITFSSPVDPATATNPNHYTVNNGVAVLGAELLYGTNLTEVVVHTTSITNTGPYTVTINGVMDQAVPPNEIEPGSTAMIRRAGAGIKAEYYGNIRGGVPISGTTLADLYGAMNHYPDHPDFIETRPELSIVPYQSTDYGVRLTGFLEAPETGEYRFSLAAQNQAILYLSTDVLAEHKRAIAGEPIRGNKSDYLSIYQRSYNEFSGSSIGDWINTNFADRASDDAPVNDSQNAVGAITLEAGKLYYIEAQVKCYGYDMLDVAWQRPGDAAITNGQPAISREFLLPARGPLDGDVTIVSQPSPVIQIQEGGKLQILAVHGGSPPFDYQWFRGTETIPDATNIVLNVPFVNGADDGAKFHVRIRNSFSEVVSESSVLDVIPDTTIPEVVRATGSQQFDRVLIRFSKQMDPVIATDPGNYQIVPIAGGEPLGVLTADVRTVIDTNLQSVTAVLLKTTPQASGTRYQITMSGLTDRTAPPHALAAPAQIDFSAWVLSPGFAYVETYTNEITGSLETYDFDGLENFPPWISSYVTSAELVGGSHLPMRMLGVVRPTSDGDHQFSLSASAPARLYIGIDGVDQPLRLIASLDAPFSYRTWGFGGSSGANVSDAISLTTGNRYAFEVRMTNSYSNAHMEINWQQPSEPTPANGTPSLIRGATVAAYADPDWATIAIDQQPEAQTTNEYSGFELVVQAHVTPSYLVGLTPVIPVIFQWQRDGVDLAGESSNRFSVASSTVLNAGTYRCRVSAPGTSVYSDEVSVNIIPHPVPALDLAFAEPDRRHVVVRFTSRIGSEMASVQGIFSIPGLTIDSVAIRPDRCSIILDTSLQTSGQVYTVNVSSIYDFDGTPVALSDGPVHVDFSAPVLTPGVALRETFTNISGIYVSDLTNSSKFPDHPDIVDYLTQVDYPHPSDPIYNSGVRISGWITPPADGDYDFYISSDNQSVLYLSTNDDPANKLAIATEPEWNNYRDFASYDRRYADQYDYFFPWLKDAPVNRSSNTVGPRSLSASQHYYFEVLKKKGSGGNDQVSVAMVPSGSPPPAIGTPGISGALISSYLSPDNRVEIALQPVDQKIPAGIASGQFSITAEPLIAGPVTYQWYRNGVAVPSANSNQVAIEPGLPGGTPVTVECKLTAPGAPEIASDVVTLTVEPFRLELSPAAQGYWVGFPGVNANYTILRATNFPAVSGWEKLDMLPPGSTYFNWQPAYSNEFLRVELTEP